MKFASFIVTFNRPAHLKQSIQVILTQTRPPDLLLIVDNGNSKETKALVEELSNDRIVYSAPGENLGSAGGCAYGLEWLYERGYDWIHHCDDDDPPATSDTLERLVKIIERVNDDKLGCVGASGSRWDWNKGTYKRLPNEALTGLVDIDVIGGNNHMVVRKEVIESVGVPEKQFFFGFYDPLYCLRVKQAGYRLVIDGELMQQYRSKAGRWDFERTQSWLPRDSYNSIWRRYYVTRNYIFRMTRTFNRPDLARREALRALIRSVASWGRGPKYGATYTKLQLRGVWDGYRGRLGRTVKPNAKTAAEQKKIATQITGVSKGPAISVADK